MRKIFLACVALLVFVVTCIPFWGSVSYGVNACDDYQYILTYHEVMDGLTGAGVRWAFVHLKDAIWMPLTWISYMFDYSLFQGALGAMHVHSLVIHGLNAVLLWWFLARVLQMTCRTRPSLFGILGAGMAALLWSLHPLRVESVTWLASRKDVLSMFFLLAALHGWLSFRASAERWRKRTWYVLSMVLLLLGAMCKPSVMIFPGLILVLDWLVLGHVAIVVLGRSVVFRDPRRWAPLLLPAVLGVLIALEGALAQRAGGALGVKGLSIFGMILNMVSAFGLYVWNTLWPLDLSVDCVSKWPIWPRGLPCGCLALVMGGGGFWACVRWIARCGGVILVPAWGVAGMLWFCGALLPFMGNFGIHAQADRFTYIPAVGLSLVVLGLFHVYPKRAKAFLMLGFPVVLTLGLMTWRQNAFWRNDGILYEHTLTVDGDDNDFAHAVLATWYWNEGHDVKKILTHFEKMAAVQPVRNQNVDYLRVMALAEDGQIEKAGKVLRDMQDRYQDEKVALEKRGAFSTATTQPQYLKQARAAYFMVQPGMSRAAAAELDEMPDEKVGQALTLYLKGRLAWLDGRKEAAVDIWQEALQAKTRGEYVGCPFVRKYIEEYRTAQRGGVLP